MTRNSDLHGNAPDKSEVALVLIDVINDLEFEGGEQLLDQALLAADNIARLKQRAKSLGVPVIYVNDNFGVGDPISKRLLSIVWKVISEADHLPRNSLQMRMITSS